MELRDARIVLTILLAALASGCGPEPDRTGAAADTDGQVAIAERPAPVGWQEIVLPSGPPEAVAVEDGGAWAAFEGGGVLYCSMSDGRWSSFDLGPAAASPVGAVSTPAGLLLLSDSALVSFDGVEAEITPLPVGFEPAGLALDAAFSPVVLSGEGSIALLTGDAWDVRSPDAPAPGSAGLALLGPDCVFTSGSTLVRYDPAADLWQYETLPGAGPVLVADGRLFSSTGGEVLERTSDGTWSTVFRGRLCGNLAVSGQRVLDPVRPSVAVAEALPVEPGTVLRASEGSPVWAVDDEGMLVCAELGAIETRIPGFDMQRIECALAGQTGSTPGGSAGVTPVLSAASGAFRIYESVSSRPDPFTEFPARRRDLRRPLSEIAIEELRLVGITLDPSGGDQAMVEDVNGVPYILYVDTELANNTRIAEITSNEVIVVQEVTVDYGPEQGGTASIPTIYTMRLHEEGGL